MTLKIRKRTDGELYAHDEDTNTVYSFCEMFIFGGSFLYATAWAREHDAHIGSVFRHMYDNRNFVRQLAELRGGVAW